MNNMFYDIAYLSLFFWDINRMFLAKEEDVFCYLILALVTLWFGLFRDRKTV